MRKDTTLDSRALSPLQAAILALTALSPVASVLLAGDEISRTVGSAVVLIWLAATLLTIMLAVVQAELAAAFPQAGGDYGTVSATLGKVPGALILFANVFIIPAFIALTAEAAAGFFAGIFATRTPAWLAACVILASLALAAVGIRLTARVTTLLVLAELAVLTVLASDGLARASLASVSGTFATPSIDVPSAAKLILVGFWAVSGAGQVVYFSEEVCERSAVGEKIFVLALFVGAVELFAVLGIAAGMQAGGAGFAAGQRGALMQMVLGLTMWSANLAIMLCYARMVFAGGRSGMLPKKVAQVWAATGSPFLAAGVLALAALVLLLFDKSAIVTASSLFSLFGAGLIAAAGIVGRARGLTGRPGQFRSRAMPHLGWLSLAALAALFCGVIA